jgi:hypothetical protein
MRSATRTEKKSDLSAGHIRFLVREIPTGKQITGGVNSHAQGNSFPHNEVLSSVVDTKLHL